MWLLGEAEARLHSVWATRPPPTRYMPDIEIRRALIGNRREGRRSLSAYGSHARGIRADGADVSAHGGAVAASRGSRWRSPAASHLQTDGGASSAGVALALVYPFVVLARIRLGTTQGVVSQPRGGGEGVHGMRRMPSIRSLDTVTADEAAAYLEHHGGDELSAACALAWDRNRLDGSQVQPDDPEIHHALFLLCRARGKRPPSFDTMRVELRRRVAAA